MAQCKGKECSHKAVSHGWCQGHNKRRERGTPIDDAPLGPPRGTGKRYTGAERFWSKVNKTDYCWLWTARTVDKDGYGVFTVTINGKRKYRKAHRVAYELEYGSSPEYDGNVQLRHWPCGNVLCVRPDHLVPGTALENARDAFVHGTKGTLSDEDVANLLSELDRGKVSQRQIAKKFGVSPPTVTLIKQGKIHKEVYRRHYNLTNHVNDGTL